MAQIGWGEFLGGSDAGVRMERVGFAMRRAG